MQDRRTRGRIRAFLAGSIVSAAARRGTDCVLRDTSEDGALLLVDQPAEVPERFALAVTGRLARPARVVWRGARSVGVAFSAGAARTDDPPPRGAVIVSLAEVRRAALAPTDAQRLAARIAQVTRRAPNLRPPPLADAAPRDGD